MDRNMEVKQYRVLFHQRKSLIAALYDTWRQRSKDQDIPEAVICTIRAVLGQTELLMKRKFFLLACVLAKEDEVTDREEYLYDLQRLWGMIDAEVGDLFAKYTHFQLLKKNKWKTPKQQTQEAQRNLPDTTRKDIKTSTSELTEVSTAVASTSTQLIKLADPPKEAAENQEHHAKRGTSALYEKLYKEVCVLKSIHDEIKAYNLKNPEVRPKKEPKPTTLEIQSKVLVSIEQDHTKLIKPRRLKTKISVHEDLPKETKPKALEIQSKILVSIEQDHAKLIKPGRFKTKIPLPRHEDFPKCVPIKTGENRGTKKKDRSKLETPVLRNTGSQIPILIKKYGNTSTIHDPRKPANKKQKPRQK